MKSTRTAGESKRAKKRSNYKQHLSLLLSHFEKVHNILSDCSLLKHWENTANKLRQGGREGMLIGKGGEGGHGGGGGRDGGDRDADAAATMKKP